jgi:hypothetical protein
VIVYHCDECKKPIEMSPPPKEEAGSPKGKRRHRIHIDEEGGAQVPTHFTLTVSWMKYTDGHGWDHEPNPTVSLHLCEACEPIVRTAIEKEVKPNAESS